MELNKNLISGIVLLSLLFSFSDASAAPGRMFNQTDMLKIEKFRKQIINQAPILKEKIRLIRTKRQSNRLIPGINKKVKFDAKDLEKHIKKGAANIKLIINMSKNINDLSGKLKTYGVRIIKRRKNMAVVDVPVANLKKMLSEVGSIENARLPRRFFPQDVVSEGIALTGSDDFHNLGYYGTGVNIAVIDIGFKGATEAVANGDLPDNVLAYAHDFTGNGLETEYYHGTACAEIIYDMAPQARIYLLKISTDADILDALDYCINNNIDIISMSLGIDGTGPGDGTGFLDEAFDEARANGILPIAAAGNNGNTTVNGITVGVHWKGMFTDTNGDGYNDFVPGDPDIYFNIFTAYPTTNDDGDPETDEVSVLLRWNDWVSPDIDYDLILFQYNTDTGDVTEIDASTDPQDGKPSEQPVEYISRDVPNSEGYLHYYAVAIVKYSGSRDVEMELYLGGTSMFMPYDDSVPISTSSNSIDEPADAESVLAVGAIDSANWLTGPQEDFSSQGPTNAWAGSIARKKPDIMGPDGVSTFTYGDLSFYGTSAATPHVAGLAALTLSKYPDLTPDELQAFLESNAIDMGAAGKDNIYGSGRLEANTSLPDNSNSGSGGGTGDGGSGGGGGGCFIATAAYGSLMEPHVVLLCKFRDRFLLTNPAGKQFVAFYYKISPPIADFIAKHDFLRVITRILLIPFFILSWAALKFGLINAFLIFLSSFTVIIKLSFVLYKYFYNHSTH